MNHHCFPRRLSEHLTGAVHAYVFDPDDLELVVTYGGGRHVGGETLRYEDAELPDEDGERGFHVMKNSGRWGISPRSWASRARSSFGCPGRKRPCWISPRRCQRGRSGTTFPKLYPGRSSAANH